MRHWKHTWIPYPGPHVAYWEKRDCPGDGIYFRGHAETCEFDECNFTRFVCDDPRYRIVEIEPVPISLVLGNKNASE